MNNYRNNRHSFYEQIPDFWWDLSGTEYSLYHCLSVDEKLVQEVRNATETMSKIFDKTARLLRQLDNKQLLDLGFPAHSLPFIKMKPIFPESVIGRFDFVSTCNGMKLLEYNSDTPTFIMECFKINGLVAAHFGHKDPNHNEEQLLSSAITKAVIESGKNIVAERKPNVVFTAHDDHEEDWNTILYLSELCKVEHNVVPLRSLKVTDDYLTDSDGIPIDVLYRQTYPLEHMLEDIDPVSQEKIGLQLLDLVLKQKLAIINPPSAFLLQPKSVQALIWGLAETGSFFTDEERRQITKYMLPTYLEAEHFIGSAPFVQKPSLGREGDTITIYDSQQTVLLKNKMQTYAHETEVYQEYAELPTVTLETEKGTEELSYMIGAFCIAGKPSAIGVRAGGKITGNESYFLPVGIHSEEEK